MTAKARRRTAEPAELELIEPDRLTTFLTDIGGQSNGVTVSIYEVNPKNRLERSFLFKLDDASEVSGPELMGRLLEHYGPGEYLALARDDSTGHMLFQPRFRVGTFRRQLELPPRPDAAKTNGAQAPAPPQSELAAVLENQTKMLSALLERVAAPVDPLATLKQLAALRELFAPPPGQPFDVRSMIGAVKDVLELRNELGGEGGGDDSALGTLARMLGPSLAKLVEQQTDVQRAAPRKLPPPQGQPLDNVNRNDPAMPNAAMLKIYVGELVRLAEQGAPPATAVERIATTLAAFPRSVQTGVLEWLNDEQVAAKLADVEPAIAKHAEWITAVVDGLLDAAGYSDEDELAADAGDDAPKRKAADEETGPPSSSAPH